jgi:hypothetical protein
MLLSSSVESDWLFSLFLFHVDDLTPLVLHAQQGIS